MARLIIIGNGYDLAHLNGQTSYKKFSEWLCYKYELKIEGGNELNFTLSLSTYDGKFLKQFGNNEEYNKHIIEIDDGRKRIFSAMLVNMIADLGDESWSDFEKNLGNLPWKKYINEANAFYKNYSAEYSPVPYGTDLITSASGTILELFAEWVEKIKVKDVEKDKIDNKIGTIKDNDFFLIFNYTNTIEKVFSINRNKNLCYIHGSALNNDEIIVGHGDNKKQGGTNLDSEEDYIQEAEAVLYKNVKEIIEKHEDFFEVVKKTFSKDKNNEIYVYGWNGCGVDIDYLKKIVAIVESSNSKCKLYINNYNGDGENKEDLWKKSGFSGDIELISIPRKQSDNKCIKLS